MRIRSVPRVAMHGLRDGVHPGSSTITDLINAAAKHNIQIVEIPGPTLSPSLRRRFRVSVGFG